MEDSRVEAEAEILVQTDAQVGVALGREQVVIGAHLGFVVRAGADLTRASVTQLAIHRRPITFGGELRLHAKRIVGIRGLTAIATRSAGAERNEGEAHAAVLTAVRVDGECPRIRLSESA